MSLYLAELNGVIVGESPYPFRLVPTGLGIETDPSDRVKVFGGDGMRPTSGDTIASQDLVFEVRVKASSAAELAELERALRSAWAPHRAAGELSELSLTVDGVEQVARGRSLGVVVASERVRGFIFQSMARLTFERLDPLWYSATFSSASLTLAALTGGFVTSLVTPLTTTTAGGARDAGVSVEGSAPSPWSVSVVATTDLVDPYLSVDGVPVVSVSGTLPAGSVTVLDSRERSLRVDGYLRPWSGFGSSWRALSPGAHTLSLRASSGEGSASWLWRDAFY